MKFKNIIGIDTGKSSIDFSFLENGEKKKIGIVENSVKKLELFFNDLKIDVKETLFCMEHTGIYNFHLLSVLQNHGANIWLENPIQIKRSMGMTRGKNDKIDAFRISKYAYLHQERAKLWQPTRLVIQNLKLLMSQRSRLNKAKKLIEIPVVESKEFIAKDQYKLLKQNCKSTLTGIKKDLALVTAQIKKIIESDDTLKELFKYVASVPNVGLITATAIIVSTNEFQKIDTARKFACHAGVAPFEYTSGSSVRGKTRISHLADKELKTVLHLATLSAISRPGELRDYFVRKVKEGKNKMLVINAIRNKLIHRVFACVRDQRKYFKKDLTFA
ncbi:MAG: IS110 family transposase [Bacteroidetes bacterium]|nr:IS110 family transposase [Bacteroidota bacterium]